MCSGVRCTLAVLSAAPYPVEMPQPSRQTLSSGALGSTFARLMSATTVYSEKVLVPMKWNSCFPLQVKRDVLSGIRPRPWVTLWETRHNGDLWWPGAELQAG